MSEKMNWKMKLENKNMAYDIFDDYTCTILRQRIRDKARNIFFYTHKSDWENIYIVDSTYDFNKGTICDLVMFNIDVTADVSENAEKIVPFIKMYTQSHAINIPYFEDNADEIAMILGFTNEIEIPVDNCYIVKFKINPTINFVM
jgi:hypothetical protein